MVRRVRGEPDTERQARRSSHPACPWSDTGARLWPETAALVYLKLGVLYDAVADFNQSEEWSRKMIEAKLNGDTYRIFLGASYALQGRLADAELEYREAIRGSEGPIDELFST